MPTRRRRDKRPTGHCESAAVRTFDIGTPNDLIRRLFPVEEDGEDRVRRALIVDDDPFQRVLLAELLQKFGIDEIAEAANGKAALALLRSPGPIATPMDIVICDLQMPEMDGIELLRALALERLTRGVLIVSGTDADILRGAEAMARALGLAILGRLRKPVQPAQLLKALKQPLPELVPNEVPIQSIDREQLLRALRDDEFYPVFQPKVTVATHELDGVEALARWGRPDAATVPPLAFVPALAREGLAMPLVDLMLDKSCRALNSWKGHGLRPGAAINVSMAVLSDLDVADRFDRVVRQHGIEPNRITLEVTETEVMADAANVLHVLSRLRLKGFRLSIDDFGTGYSSLHQLYTLPFTELKIDQVFVRDCGKSRRLRHILESSIELAHRLGIPAVAEGVESESEWSFLKSRECDEAQGFLIARPMPGADFPKWAAAWRAGAERETSG